MTEPTPADTRRLDAAEPAETTHELRRTQGDERRYGAAYQAPRGVYTVSDPEQRDPSNADIRTLTAPLDHDDNVVALVDTQGNSADAPSGLR